MGEVEYVAWLHYKEDILCVYIGEKQRKLKRYHDEIGQMAEGMSIFGQLEHERTQLEHVRDMADAVDRDVLRKSLVLTATRNEIESRTRETGVTIEAVENYIKENEDMLEERGQEYWNLLWNE
jgi:hypothetical protein